MAELRSVHNELCLKDRSTLTLDYVKSISSFADDYLSLVTSLGEVTVEGEELKIEDLSRESGRITVTGKINGFYFSESGGRERRLFKRKV